MARVNAALAVIVLVFAAAVALYTVVEPGMSWKYDKVYKDLGRLSDVIATADDDIWVVGNATDTVSYAGDDTADDGFLLHYDGTRWQRRPMPAAFGDSVYEARFDEMDSGGFLLTASLSNRNAPRMARWDGTRWTAVPVISDIGRAVDVRAFAADDIWALAETSRVWHWDGTRWAATDLPAAVSSLDGVAPDDLWAVGHQGSGESRESGHETIQPAAVHWDGRSWTPASTPEYRFPDPVPPEAEAFLTEVLAVAGDDVRAYGSHTFNHGEVEDEPADEHIRLRWDGTRWSKQPSVEGDCATRVPVAADGERGVFLNGNRYLTTDGDCERIKRPRLPSTGGIRDSSQQSLWLNGIEPIPGTDEVLGVGHVQVNQAGNPTSRSVIVHLKR
ncbi:hypothetical protein H1V43_09010 [Streptomyces sp. PSKA54]|uniref:Uncharacterized protein n=1 Tax=Streptomyces himalayensis subsp. aureolus TaxID=2758039 RepID=A0A7W2CYL1_9ACTN|nr:hypothetical protein [Streptomyces himalayensis]MBA4861522.1 hypothetical protein [Streptomyces himalayensis subsp. aureolus]